MKQNPCQVQDFLQSNYCR